MSKEKIIEFIDKHHLLSLASTYEDKPYCANCFYAFSQKTMRFIIASSDDTKHMKQLSINPSFAGTIALETKEIGKIIGIQFTGVIEKANLKEKALYLKTYPYALALNPTLWSLHVKYIKLTDNRLGFGKKFEINL